MKKAYKEMLSGLKPANLKSKGSDDRVLLIDGLNTFIRSFTINPSKNEDGIHYNGHHVLHFSYVNCQIVLVPYKMH